MQNSLFIWFDSVFWHQSIIVKFPITFINVPIKGKLTFLWFSSANGLFWMQPHNPKYASLNWLNNLLPFANWCKCLNSECDDAWSHLIHYSERTWYVGVSGVHRNRKQNVFVSLHTVIANASRWFQILEVDFGGPFQNREQLWRILSTKTHFQNKKDRIWPLVPLTSIGSSFMNRPNVANKVLDRHFLFLQTVVSHARIFDVDFLHWFCSS